MDAEARGDARRASERWPVAGIFGVGLRRVAIGRGFAPSRAMSGLHGRRGSLDLCDDVKNLIEEALLSISVV